MSEAPTEIFMAYVQETYGDIAQTKVKLKLMQVCRLSAYVKVD